MLRVGLTGGIGSGKSTVAKLFEEFQVPIIDADAVAKEIILQTTSIHTAINEKFGITMTEADQTLNRKRLREIIFNDLDAKKWLENLLHPLIKNSILTETRKIQFPYCIIVIPLLIETGSYDLVDRIVIVETDEQSQVCRVARRDQISDNFIAKIIATQATKAQRSEIADDVILNNNTLRELREQVEKLHTKYLQLATSNHL